LTKTKFTKVFSFSYFLEGLGTVFMPSPAISGRRHSVPGRPCVRTCVRYHIHVIITDIKVNLKKLLKSLEVGCDWIITVTDTMVEAYCACGHYVAHTLVLKIGLFFHSSLSKLVGKSRHSWTTPESPKRNSSV